MEQRVRDLLSKKERVIESLKQQLAQVQHELDVQRRELMEQINM